MSYSFDGKVSNQAPAANMSGKALCAKCSKQLVKPLTANFTTKNQSEEICWEVHHYLQQAQFIYETRKGVAVVYCSRYCRDKHNHRFN